MEKLLEVILRVRVPASTGEAFEWYVSMVPLMPGKLDFDVRTKLYSDGSPAPGIPHKTLLGILHLFAYFRRIGGKEGLSENLLSLCRETIQLIAEGLVHDAPGAERVVGALIEEWEGSVGELVEVARATVL